jgi:hypothetical protein
MHPLPLIRSWFLLVLGGSLVLWSLKIGWCAKVTKSPLGLRTAERGKHLWEQ